MDVYLLAKCEVSSKILTSFRQGVIFFLPGDDGYKNTFLYQPTPWYIRIKKREMNLLYPFHWKSKGVYNYKLKSVYTAFLLNIKLSGYRVRINLCRTISCRTNHYLIKIVTVFMVCDWDASPRDSTNIFKFEKHFFGPTSIVKISDKEKYVSRGYGKTFDSAGSWSFNNGTARNVIIFMWIIVYHFILKITSIIFYCYAIVQLLKLTKALIHQKKN